MDLQQKFEMTLEQLQRRSSLDKEKYQQTTQELIQLVEQKYERQVKDLKDLNAQAMSDQQQKERNLEKEVR